jgi:E3 ubiquitin-protein ligase Topors
MEEVEADQAQADAQRAEASLLTIKGAARDGADIKRLTLLERLAKAKAERAAAASTLTIPSPTPIEEEPPPITTKGRGLRARIQLKIKLESENKQFRHNLNTSKAQALRTRLLEAKAKREAEETDLGLKRLDIIDRKKEVRRRLMVLKMMAAETDQERRARELRDRLMARKRGNLGLGVTA